MVTTYSTSDSPRNALSHSHTGAEAGGGVSLQAVAGFSEGFIHSFADPASRCPAGGVKLTEIGYVRTPCDFAALLVIEPTSSMVSYTWSVQVALRCSCTPANQLTRNPRHYLTMLPPLLPNPVRPAHHPACACPFSRRTHTLPPLSPPPPRPPSLQVAPPTPAPPLSATAARVHDFLVEIHSGSIQGAVGGQPLVPGHTSRSRPVTDCAVSFWLLTQFAQLLPHDMTTAQARNGV